MFTQHTPRTGRPVGNATKSAINRIGAGIGVCALTAGFALVAPTAASAATLPSSFAEGQFLSGSLLGVNLDSIVELEPATASNNGSQPVQRSDDPLNLTVLSAVELDYPSGIQTSLGEFLDAGALNQYAEASKDGSSLAASGAIGDDGGIGIGQTGTGAAGDLNLDLDSLLDSRYASILTDLRLSLDAVAAQATGNLDTASGDYTLAGATLTFTSPAIAQLTPKVTSALGPVDEALLNLSGDDGVLGNAVDGVVDPVLGSLGSSANVTATVTTDIHGAVQSLLTGEYGNGAVSFNLQTGEVSVDLAELLGGDLNNLAPGTELLSGPVVNQILKGITDTVSSLSDQIIDRVEVALDSAQVNVHADLDLLSPQGSQDGQVCRDIQVPIIGDILTPITGGLLGGNGGGLLGGLLGGGQGNSGGTTVTQGIIGYTTNTVCDLVSNVLPDLRSTVNVDVQGTVQQILDGTATRSDASVSLLGGTVQASIDINGILDGLAAGLTDSLFDSDGAVAQITDRLNTGLVNPAVDGLLGSTSVDTVLSDIVSVKVNVQEVGGGEFTETAVRVAVLQGAGSSGLATVNLAQATVGPNVVRVIDPCTVNCGPVNPDPNCTVNCGPVNPDPNCTTNCTTGGNPGNPSISATNRLAYTGVGIATLIAVILALLAAGAYLAREGYRRNHAESVGTD